MPKFPSTQQFIDLDNIRNYIIILKGGRMRAILKVSSTNLALKSQEEQEATVFSYQNFLNALDFPIQILVSSRFMNLDNYVKNLRELVGKQSTELMQIQTQEYINFIEEFLSQAHIISTDFYVVIPFNLVDIGVGEGGGGERLKSLIGKQSELGSLEQEKFLSYKKQIAQRAEFVASNLHRIGLEARLLNTEELISLFWSLYNPEDLRRKGITRPIFT